MKTILFTLLICMTVSIPVLANDGSSLQEIHKNPMSHFDGRIGIAKENLTEHFIEREKELLKELSSYLDEKDATLEITMSNYLRLKKEELKEYIIRSTEETKQVLYKRYEDLPLILRWIAYLKVDQNLNKVRSQLLESYGINNQ